MNIERAKQEIKQTVLAYTAKDSAGAYLISTVRQRPILMIGPPGVGKTQIIEQIAQELGIGLVSYTMTHHTRQSAVGLPMISQKSFGGREYSVTEYTMSEIIASVYDMLEHSPGREGILFLDEINCVSETLAPTMLQFLQAKTFGTHRLPEGVVIVTAGNPPEYNKSVRELDVVTLDRIKRLDIEADYEVWKQYAHSVGIHPAIIAYLNIKPQHFSAMETMVDGRYFVTPRAWEDLSALLHAYEQLGLRADRELTGQYLQYPKISKDFANYLELYGKYQNSYQVEEILAGRFSEGLCSRLAKAAFDERIAVVELLISALATRAKRGELEPAQLEAAFDFLEASYGASQELVVFITEFNMNEHLLRYVQRHPSERYYQYNRELLFEDTEARLQDKLHTLRTELAAGAISGQTGGV